jgi:hypothetical protein
MKTTEEDPDKRWNHLDPPTPHKITIVIPFWRIKEFYIKIKKLFKK